MLNKKLIIGTLLIGLFSTGLVAKDANYEAAKKPEITLKKSDLDVLAKAKSKNFKGLSTKEKEQLLKFLDDYVASAKKEKVTDKKGKVSDKKGKVAPKKGKPSQDKAIMKDLKKGKTKK